MNLRVDFLSQQNWHGQKVWTLTTRREKDKARIFKDLTRLNDFLKEKIYTEEVKIIRIK